ncbi:MAG: DUF1573 domain-containing protein [Candidatus Symbiothrix sp.]|jgi:hypothetical protein|nr:DUF1573 domain-containing protein [Candidatus Symbiothrix sp.]
MKKLILFVAIAVMGLTAANTLSYATPQTAQETKVVSVDRPVHDFGTVQETAGDVKTVFYVINNTGAPIMITNVKTTCGCTVPAWTKTPIEPGKKGEIAVTYSTKDRPGPFDKEITILTSGEPNTLKVHIKGTVQ